jgi:hypothetical protein
VYIYTISPPFIGYLEGDDGEAERAGGNQLIISDTVIHTLLHTFGQKSNDDIYIPF